MDNLLLMRHFSEKYGIPQHTLSRRISEYQTELLTGCVKPRIVDSQFNRELAEKHKSNPAHRPCKGQLSIEDFCAKYQIDRSRIEIRYRSLEKVLIGDLVLIKETRSNLRHCKLIP
jgi:hypothetical protein